MTVRSLLWVFNYEKPRVVKNKKNSFMMRKMFFIEVQRIRFHPNGWVKPGTFSVNEERRAILSKHEFIWSKEYKNSIPTRFNINKW